MEKSDSNKKYTFFSEFTEYRSNYDNSIVNTIASFLNGSGGEIIIGADEKTKFGVSNPDEIVKKIKNDFKLFFPPIEKIMVTEASEDDITIITIEVIKSMVSHFVKKNGKYILYHRLNNRNFGVSYNKKDAQYIVNQEYGLKSINSIKLENGHEYQQIGLFSCEGFFYKYMSLETALLCIRNSTIRFTEPSAWNDNYEKRFYNAIINGKNQSDDNPPLAACCLTYKQDNEAAWKIYSYEKKGLDSRCVEFMISRYHFIEQLLEAINENDSFKHYKLYEGIVTYKDEYFINSLHSKDHNSSHLFFDHFSLEKYLSLLLLKRNAFEHEQEVRFFLLPDNQSNPLKKGDIPPIDIPINWSKVLVGIRIDSNCTQFEKNLLKEELFTKGNSGKPIWGRDNSLNPKSYNVYEQKEELPLEIN